MFRPLPWPLSLVDIRNTSDGMSALQLTDKL